jgi:DNA invertase Pin-like site-specific DNA recombinase
MRVSTADQTADIRLLEIEAAGFNIDPRRVITETVSGSVAAKERDSFKQQMDRFEWDDLLIVTKRERLGKNDVHKFEESVVRDAHFAISLESTIDERNARSVLEKLSIKRKIASLAKKGAEGMLKDPHSDKVR